MKRSGALAQAFTSDRFGRRGSILIWAAIFTVGVAIQTGTEFSIVQLTIGRFVAGLGVGALSGMLKIDSRSQTNTNLGKSSHCPVCIPLLDSTKGSLAVLILSVD